MFKTLAFRWHNNLKYGFTKAQRFFHPGHPKTVVTNANIADVASLIKRDARLIVKSIAHSVDIILTQ